MKNGKQKAALARGREALFVSHALNELFCELKLRD